MSHLQVPLFLKSSSHRWTMASPPWKDPCGTVDEIAALGLRHVGYAVPIELFEPFVEGGRRLGETDFRHFGGPKGLKMVGVFVRIQP